jgi:hypothetical protein
MRHKPITSAFPLYHTSAHPPSKLRLTHHRRKTPAAKPTLPPNSQRHVDPPKHSFPPPNPAPTAAVCSTQSAKRSRSGRTPRSAASTTDLGNRFSWAASRNRGDLEKWLDGIRLESRRCCASHLRTYLLQRRRRDFLRCKS